METKSKVQNEKRFKKMSHTNRGSNRYKKFVGNRAEGQGFADKRKKKIKQEYFRMLQKEKKKGISRTQRVWSPRLDEDEREEDRMKFRSSAPQTVQEGGCSEQQHNVEESHRTDLRFNRRVEEQSDINSQNTDRHNRKQSHWKFKKEGKNIFSRAIHEAKVRKEEAQKRREQKQKDREERETALQNYRKKKRENFYKFHCKKTKKGQPLMRYQMEFLLQKIEKQRERENNTN